VACSSDNRRGAPGRIFPRYVACARWGSTAGRKSFLRRWSCGHGPGGTVVRRPLSRTLNPGFSDATPWSKPPAHRQVGEVFGGRRRFAECDESGRMIERPGVFGPRGGRRGPGLGLRCSAGREIAARPCSEHALSHLLVEPSRMARSAVFFPLGPCYSPLFPPFQARTSSSFGSAYHLLTALPAGWLSLFPNRTFFLALDWTVAGARSFLGRRPVPIQFRGTIGQGVVTRPCGRRLCQDVARIFVEWRPSKRVRCRRATVGGRISAKPAVPDVDERVTLLPATVAKVLRVLPCHRG